MWTDVERGREVGEDAKMLQGVGVGRGVLEELIKADDEDLMVRLRRS